MQVIAIFMKHDNTVPRADRLWREFLINPCVGHRSARAAGAGGIIVAGGRLLMMSRFTRRPRTVDVSSGHKQVRWTSRMHVD